MSVYKEENQKSILFLFFTIFILQMDVGFSQNQVTGQVFRAKDSIPIYNASVYFDGTSLGVTTNEEGYFKISFEKNNSPLIISIIGYEPIIIHSQTIQTNKILPNIYLPEKLEELNTVYIETDTWSRLKKIKMFKREFLGRGKAARLCRIINEDSIKLRYISSSKTLIATSNVPLIVENKYLGYLLEYNLRDFQVKFKMNNNVSSIPISINYHGFVFFKRLENNSSIKISRNRKKSYLGSTLHFMRALYSKNLDENDFKIYYQWVEVPAYKYFKITDFENKKHIKPLVNKLVIRYKVYNQSVMVLKDEFTIDYSGHHAPPESIILNGEMSKKRISELLPLGYNLQ